MTEDLEQRVRRWLQREATEGAPVTLRRRLAATELPADRARRWLTMPRLVLVAGTVALALIVTVTTLLLVSGQRRVGAYSCDPSLIAHVEDAIAHAAGYSVTGTGTVLTFQGSSPTDTTYRTVDITVNLAFRSPHDAFMSASMADTVMAGSFPVQTLAANTTVTRVGNLVRFGANGSDVSALPDGVDPDLAAPNPLTLILQQAAADRMTWTATAGQDGCRLHGEAPAELQMPDDQRSLDLVVDTGSAEVRRIHDVYSHPVPPPSSGATQFEPSSGWDMTYAVEWSARPEIVLPPMPSESGAPTPSALATSCTPDLLFNLEQILTGSAGYRAVGTGQGSASELLPDPSVADGGIWQVTMEPVAQDLVYSAPDRVEISTTTEPAGPPVQFGTRPPPR